jgi:hypothetical protein
MAVMRKENNNSLFKLGVGWLIRCCRLFCMSSSYLSQPLHAYLGIAVRGFITLPLVYLASPFLGLQRCPSFMLPVATPPGRRQKFDRQQEQREDFDESLRRLGMASLGGPAVCRLGLSWSIKKRLWTGTLR